MIATDEQLFSSLERQFGLRKAQLEAQQGKSLDWTIEDQSERIERAQEDFFYFCKEYFPEDWFFADFAWFHHVLIDILEDETGQFHNFAGFRGAGKTRLARIHDVHSNIFGKWQFIGQVGRNLRLAGANNRLIMLEFIANPKIIADFGHLVDPYRNAMHDFKTVPTRHNETGTVNKIYSLEATPRSELEDTRPQFFRFEDIEDYESSINPELSKKRLEIIKRDFLKAMDARKANAVYLSNNPVDTCITNALLEMEPEERNEFFPKACLTLIPRWNTGDNTIVKSEQVSDEWPLNVIANQPGPNWKEADGIFESEHQMRVYYQVDKVTWDTEDQLRPTVPQGDVFIRENWQQFEQLPEDATGIIWVDPAQGTKTSYKAASVDLFSPSTKLFYNLLPFVRNSGWTELFDHLNMVLNVLSGRVSAIYWENYFKQDEYIPLQEIAPHRKNLPPLPIVPAAIPGEKHHRIARLEPYYNAGQILFSRDFTKTEDGARAKRTLVSYRRGKSAEVDWVDAKACGHYKLFELKSHLMNGNSDSPGRKNVYTFKRRTNTRW